MADQKQKAKQQSVSSVNSTQRIRNALGDMVVFRQCAPDRVMLAKFTERLSQENADDVCAALKRIQELPREPGQTALPELAVILAQVTYFRNVREVKESKINECYVVWQCPDCGSRMGGFTSSEDKEQRRRCRGIPKTQRTDGRRICGALMVEIQRDDTKDWQRERDEREGRREPQSWLEKRIESEQAGRFH